MWRTRPGRAGWFVLALAVVLLDPGCGGRGSGPAAPDAAAGVDAAHPVDGGDGSDAAQPDAPANGDDGTNFAHDDPFTAERTRWWRDAHFGMFIHFGVYSELEGSYTSPTGAVCQDAEWIMRQCNIPVAEYEAVARRFNPAAFDADAIVRLAKAAGQRYIVMTSKHHDGFAMWPTLVNDWNLRDHSAFSQNRDLLAELKAACDREGVVFGLYYSIWDWHNPNFTADWAQYKRDMYAQLRELIEHYHPAVLWFDGEWQTDTPYNPWSAEDGDELQSYLHVLDPALIVNNRVDKRRIEDGDFGTPEQEIPAAPVDGQLWESCMTINDHWGFASYDTRWKSPVDITRHLLDIVSRSGNYLLNIGPDRTGAVPAGAVDALHRVGAWLAANDQGATVYGAGVARMVQPPPWGAVAAAGDRRLLLSVYDWPGAGGTLHLSTVGPLTIEVARVLGSPQTVTWTASGDGVDLRPSGAATSDIATVIELRIARPKPVVGTGTGLRGEYWDNDVFVGAPRVTRLDRTLNFSWRYRGVPHPDIPGDHFAARWTGAIQAPYTATYTFLTVSDDTVAVWIDDQLVVQNPTPHGAAVDRGTIALEAGRTYSIRVEQTEQAGEATLKLLWYAPDLGQQIVPTRQLYPPQ